VSLAGSRDPFSIPPGLELSTGGSVSPTATAAGTTSTLPPPLPPTTTTTSPPAGGGGGGEHPGNKILIGGRDVKLIA
jgi:hypothetical protein